MEAEYIALTEATKELLWIKHLPTELGCGDRNPTGLFTDNQSPQKLKYVFVYFTGNRNIKTDNAKVTIDGTTIAPLRV